MKKDLDSIIIDNYNLTPRQFYLKYKKELEDFTFRIANDFKITRCAYIKFKRKTRENKNVLGVYEIPGIIYIYLQNIVESSFNNKDAITFDQIIQFIKSNIIHTLIHEYFHLLQYVNYNYVYKNYLNSLKQRKIKYIEDPNNKHVYLYLLKNIDYITNKYNIKKYIFIEIIDKHNYQSLYSYYKYKRISGFSIFKRILKMYNLYNIMYNADTIKDFFYQKILGENFHRSILSVQIGNKLYTIKYGNNWKSIELMKLEQRLYKIRKNHLQLSFAYYSAYIHDNNK